MQVKHRSFSGRANLSAPEEVFSCHVLTGMNYLTLLQQLVSLNK